MTGLKVNAVLMIKMKRQSDYVNGLRVQVKTCSFKLGYCERGHSTQEPNALKIINLKKKLKRKAKKLSLIQRKTFEINIEWSR